MKFSGVCLVTDNVSKLKKFYENVFSVDVNGDDEFAYFMFEKINISIFSKAGEEKIAPGSMKNIGNGSCIIEIEVEDVDYEFAKLSELGVKIIKPPTTQPWGIRSVWFSDPDGNIINFCCNVSNNNETK